MPESTMFESTMQNFPLTIGMMFRLGSKIAKWQLPERWAFIDEIPKTSVGKFDKKVLCAGFGDGQLDVEILSS